MNLYINKMNLDNREMEWNKTKQNTQIQNKKMNRFIFGSDIIKSMLNIMLFVC